MLSTLRVTQAALRRHARTATAAAASNLPATTFAPVKFAKEDVEVVMSELPDFNYYEIKVGSGQIGC